MKKLLKLGGLLALTTLLSQTALAQSSEHDGLYIGAGAGYDDTSYQFAEIEPSPAAEFLVGPSANPYETSGVSSTIFIGYRQSANRFTVAAEAFVGYNFASNNNNPDFSFETTAEYGVNLLPGFWVTDEVVAFGKIGFSNLKMNGDWLGTVFDSTDSGFHYGGGLQLYLDNQFSIRADYTRSTYHHNMRSTFSSTLGGTAVSQNYTVFFTNNFKRDRFMGSLIVNF